MGNILTKLKRFLTNKNTVTILCVLAGILLLYIGYNWRVNSATQPISVPYAKNTLSSGHLITSEDIGTMEVSGTVLEKTKGIIRNRNQLIGKEVSYGNTIQANSFFYSEDVKDATSNDYNVLEDIEDGYAPINLDVDLHSTFGNAIYPGNYIDLWFRGTDTSGKLIYGKFIKSIKVLDVTDSNSKSVFETGAESREPAHLLFAVEDEMMELIHAAQQVGELVPVPRNKSYSLNPLKIEIASTYLQNYILSQVAITTNDSNVNDSTNSSNSDNTFEDGDDEEEDVYNE